MEDKNPSATDLKKLKDWNKSVLGKTSALTDPNRHFQVPTNPPKQEEAGSVEVKEEPVLPESVEKSEDSGFPF